MFNHQGSWALQRTLQCVAVDFLEISQVQLIGAWGLEVLVSNTSLIECLLV